MTTSVDTASIYREVLAIDREVEKLYARRAVLADLVQEHAAKRVLARITEEDEQTYRVRCEQSACAWARDCSYAYDSLAKAAGDARAHAISTGHAVLVEAL